MVNKVKDKRVSLELSLYLCYIHREQNVPMFSLFKYLWGTEDIDVIVAKKLMFVGNVYKYYNICRHILASDMPNCTAFI